MQSDQQSIDESNLPGIPTQKTLALVNTYLVHTTRLLNEFAASVEHRLQETRSRINQVDAKLQLLEAKVQSAYSSSQESAPAIEGGGQEGERPSCPSKVEGPESVASEVDLVEQRAPLESLQGDADARQGPSSKLQAGKAGDLRKDGAGNSRDTPFSL